ncbi:MAG TPA: hypothetical protein DDZ42_09225 [Candidatus Rokubacteria bacterium]|nr:hypothetical protein [Candidatus Rokubacteria bacterium]
MSGSDPRISRRALLRGVSGTLAAGGLGACARRLEPLPLPSAGEPGRPRRDLPPVGRGWSGRLPVVDFHTHLQRRVSAEELVRLMDAAGVPRMILMPLYYRDSPRAVNDGEGSDEQAAEYARRYPERFVPFVGMQRPDLVSEAIWWTPTTEARWLVRETDAKLRSGEFFGMGEFMLRFYPYTNRFGIVAPSDMDYPADSYLMRTFADLSARHHAPMVIHCEAEPRAADAMVRLLEKHPEAIVVWAHNCGRSSAWAIQALFTRFPNLYADLGGMVYSGPRVEAYGVYWPRRTPWMHLVVNDRGALLPEMKALLEAHSDRFFAGTDVAHARVYEFYVTYLPRWRYVLSQLSAQAARNIAFANANRLLGSAPG